MQKFSPFFVLFGLIVGFLDVNVQYIIAALGIVSVGILHGANDLQIIKQIFTESGRNINKNFILYLGVVLLGGILFYIVPATALAFFVGISAYHFGEQHFENRLRVSSRVFFSLYGGLIFSLIFYSHLTETQEVILSITGIQISSNLFKGVLLCLGLSVLIWMFLITSRKTFFRECLVLIGISMVFWNSSLIFSFAFYFCFFHSFPSLRSQLFFLFGEISKASVYRYIRQSFVYWILALTGLAGVYGFISWEYSKLLPLFFVFLAAITFPHVVVMGYLFHKSSKAA